LNGSLYLKRTAATNEIVTLFISEPLKWNSNFEIVTGVKYLTLFRSAEEHGYCKIWGSYSGEE